MPQQHVRFETILDKRDAQVLIKALKGFAKKKSVSQMNRLVANELLESIEDQAKHLGIKKG